MLNLQFLDAKTCVIKAINCCFRLAALLPSGLDAARQLIRPLMSWQ